MGLLTLADFRDEVDKNLGERSIDPNRLDRWINMALFDFSQAFDLSEKQTTLTFNTVEGQQAYDIAGQDEGILAIFDLTNERKLLRLGVAELKKKKREPLGRPARWAREGKQILFAPIPDGEYEIELTLRVPLTALEGSSDVTDIHPTWDLAIVLGASAYGALAIGEDASFERFYARYVDYLQTRERDRDQGSPMPGVEVATSENDLTRMR